jgi:hypothetical protein
MVSREDHHMRTAGFTTVIADGSPNYVDPHEPACPASRRYMAVHRVDGGGWGIVDRRSGQLLKEARPGEHRYASWADVLSVVKTMNGASAA